MASLIKNRILKHLSIFAKNLTPDKIHLSTLRGEGNLSDLELDEVVLNEVLDLPSWLQISKAVCNKLFVTIQWTKLRTRPICLYLDEVTVEMETCEELRKLSSTSILSAYSTSGKYGFAERIIDGMYICINSVQVNFHATAFTASIQLSRLIIESRSPTWREAASLRQTRIQHTSRDQILQFKEVSWQTLKVEANALGADSQGVITTPLRLISNQSKVRITMKKKLSDCSIIASRLQVNLDDLLWVLTDLQLKAALVFANSLKEIIKKSTQQSKLSAAEKLKQQHHQVSPVHVPSQTSKVETAHDNMNDLFVKYDIAETSYHLHTGRIDLHLCDDATADGTYTRRVEGGAMQLIVYKLNIDYYPFHTAGAARKNWMRYDDNMAASESWVRTLLDVFKADVRRTRDIFLGKTSANDTNGIRVPGAGGGHQVAAPGPARPSNSPAGRRAAAPGPARSSNAPAGHQAAAPLPTQLLECCVIVRIEDLVVHQVSTAGGRGGGASNAPRPLVCSEKEQLLLPPEMTLLHLEFTDYYFPQVVDFPESSNRDAIDNEIFVPHANLCVLVNPVKLTVDFLSLLWLNAFVLNLTRQLELPQATGPNYHIDFKLDALMPKLVLPASCPPGGQPDRPTSLHLRASRLSLTNCRSDSGKSSRAELASTLDALRSPLFTGADAFPNAPGDARVSADAFRRHVDRTDGAYVDRDVERALLGTVAPPGGGGEKQQRAGGGSYYSMRADSFKCDAQKDVWCVDLEQVWAEFAGVPSAHGRPLPLLESCPVTLWVHAAPSRSAERSPSPPSPRASDSGKVGDESRSNESSRASDEIRITANDSGKDADETENDAVVNRSRSSDPSRPGAPRAVSVVAAVPAPLRLQLDHYALLFLLRLSDAVADFQAALAADVAALAPPASPPRITVALTVPAARIALVCPPIPVRAAGRDDSLDGGESGVGSANHDAVPSLTEPVVSKSVSEASIVEPVGHDVTPSSPSSPSSPSPPVSPAIEACPDEPLFSDVGGSITIKSDAVSFSSLSDLSSCVDAKTEPVAPPGGDAVKRSLNALSNFSRGLGTSYSRITGRGRPAGGATYGEEGEEWDILSVRSEAFSDDDDTDSLLRLADVTELPAFDVSAWPGVGEVNEGSEVNSVGTGSTTDNRMAGMVSVIVLNCEQVEMVTRSCGDDVSVALQLHRVTPNELGNVNVESFRTTFAADVPAVTPPATPAPGVTSPPPVSLRYSLGPGARAAAAAALSLPPTAPLPEAAADRGWLHCRVNALHVPLMTSSLASLADLTEDEVIVPQPPMLVEMVNATLTLKDDKPPTHSTSPGVVPVEVKLHDLVIRRTEDGVIHVSGGGNNLPGQTSRCDTAACSAPGDSETNQVGSDVETTLQERLVSVERTNSELERECAQLKEGAADRGRWMEERDVLRAERESLLRMLQNLQEELTTSEDMRMRMASAQEATGN